MTIDTKKKHVRYCPYMPITRVNSDYHEISQEKTLSQLKIITNTQSQSPVTITWCNTVLSAALRSYSSSSPDRNRLPRSWQFVRGLGRWRKKK